MLIGLMGQMVWMVENMYFNVFLYNTISTDPTYITDVIDREGKLNIILPAAAVLVLVAVLVVLLRRADHEKS